MQREGIEMQPPQSSIIYERSHAGTIYENRSECFGALPHPSAPKEDYMQGQYETVGEGLLPYATAAEHASVVRANSQTDLLDEEESPPSQPTAPQPLPRPSPRIALSRPHEKVPVPSSRPPRPLERPQVFVKPAADENTGAKRFGTMRGVQQIMYVPAFVTILAVISAIFFLPLGVLALAKLGQVSDS